MYNIKKIKNLMVTIVMTVILGGFLCGVLYNMDNTAFASTVTDSVFIQPTTLEELRQSDPSKIAELDKYDSRIYGTDGVDGIIPPIENQGNLNICWSYATMAAAEISILREGLWNQRQQGVLDFCEKNNAFVAINNDGSLDPLGLTSNDNFSGKWDDGLNPSYSVQRMLSTWNSPTIFNNGDVTTYKNADFKVEDIIKINHKDIDAIKYAVAKYGAVTMAYNTTTYADDYYFNGNAGQTKGGHACAIVGWDDSIDKNEYRVPSATNGGWIIRNSWGNYPNSDNGYFCMSYDTKITDTYALDFTTSDKYDYNYHYDSYPQILIRVIIRVMLPIYSLSRSHL